MKKISEMSEDELRDYALQLEGEKTVNEQALADKDNEINDLKGLNLDLQKRNKELFLKVEQQVITDPVPPVNNPNEDNESMEDFIKNKLKGVIK